MDGIYRRLEAFEAHTGLKPNIAASVAINLGVIHWALLAPDIFFVASASSLFAILLLALALTMPLKIGALVFVAGLGTNCALQTASKTKAALTCMPLTSLDLTIFANNPSGFIGAMKWSPAIFFGTATIVAALLIGGLVWISTQHVSRHGRPEVRVIALSTAACLLLASTVPVLSARLQQTVKPYSRFMPRPWWPPALNFTSDYLGVFPFLLLSSKMAKGGSAMLLRKNLDARPAPVSDLLPYIRKFIKIQDQPKLAPNIVMVLLESTFDINETFALSPPFRSNLTARFPGAQIRGNMSVNVIGGGTWISEFETMTGLDSRLFGYLGFYTHIAVSPFIKSTLATFLGERNFKTMGLYPVPGNFYSARTGYDNYGVHNFFDSDDFGISDPWKNNDRTFMRQYIKQMNGDKSRPFAAFALTLENHAPHGCVHFKTKQFPHKLVGEDNPAMNCQVNEFIRRQKSTAAAIEMLEQHLRKLEKKTGRPYVLALYGDHQPHTFVGTKSSKLIKHYNYDKLRKTPKRQTFFQIRSSMKSPFTQNAMDIPITLLPTLISAYVAKSETDLYMPVNLMIYAKCGSSIDIATGQTVHSMQPGSSGKLKKQCAEAIAQALPAYRSLALRF